MSENPIVEWYSKDQWLKEFLVSIDEQNLSDNEAAKTAFYQLADHYKLPKFPGDNEAAENDTDSNLFEQMAIARFLFPDDEYKGIVMLAAYNIYNNTPISIAEAAAEYYGTYDAIPQEYFVYFFGADVDATILFDIGEMSWIEAGAVFMKKVFRNDI